MKMTLSAISKSSFCCAALYIMLASSSASALEDGRPVSSPPAIELTVEGTRIFPESITSTSDGTLIVGSSANGIIYRLTPGNKRAVPWIYPAITKEAGGPSLFGVLADEGRDTIWACHVYGQAGQGKTAIARYSHSGAKLLSSHEFDGPGLCNDIALDETGIVYATDMTNGRIMRLTRDGTVQQWIKDPALAGVDGIIVHPKRGVIANNIRTGKLFQIPVKHNGKAGPLQEIALSRPLEQPDGMRANHDGSLLVVEGTGRLSHVRFGRGIAMVETLQQGLVEPVAVTMAQGKAYVLQGYLSYLFQPEKRTIDPGPAGIYVIKMADNK